jgi:N-acetylglutamate synthase-like GNAT family acetyltransferase
MGIKIMIRQVRITDFNQLRPLYETHADEAKVAGKLTFDVEKAMELTKKRLIDNQSNILIYIRDDRAVGYAVISLSQLTWSEVRVGNIEMFYIHPEYRKNISSHKFLDQIEDYMREQDIEIILSGVFLFDKDYNVDETYVDRASKYFEAKGMKWCGNIYVKEL